MAPDSHFRLAVKDSRDNTLGYKSDSFWTLLDNFKDGKVARLTDGEVPRNLLDNFLVMLNDDPETNGFVMISRAVGDKNIGEERDDLTVVAQHYGTGEEIRRYEFRKGANGQYTLEDDPVRV